MQFDLHQALYADLITQSEVFLVIFGKIQGLCFFRNTLARIVKKLSAGIVGGDQPPLGAQYNAILQLRAVGTVCTGFLYALAKQHGLRLTFVIQW